ncbi:hypothetical protein SAMN05428970_2595 [Agromyces sp. CF514]|nr:hypothetical protein SAMN05428970_2595 [Agromyces sp. CF514]
MRESEPEWVHEVDYGAPAFGGVIVGLALIV